jgi:hypothetical protein
MGFNPALGDLAVVLKTGKPFRMLNELVNEILDGELDISQDAARVAVVPYTGQE